MGYVSNLTKRQIGKSFRSISSCLQNVVVAALVFLAFLAAELRNSFQPPLDLVVPMNTGLSTTNPPLQKCLDLQLDDDTKNRVLPSPTETDKCLLYSKPSLYIQTVMTFAVGTPNQLRCHFHSGCTKYVKYDENLRKYGNDWPPFGYTMVGKVRLENFRAAIEEVDRNGIRGAIIEMGVWRGGAMILAAAVTLQAASNRDLYLFDAFESIPGYGRFKNFLENSMEEVQGNFDLFGLNGPNVHFVKGLFKDTIPTWKKGTSIAVLRVDGNFYDSYQDAMYTMYEDIPIGGIVIFDDVMSHPPVKQFWIDFKSEQNLPEDLNRIDTHSAWFRKRVHTKIDQSKKHPPQDVNT